MCVWFRFICRKEKRGKNKDCENIVLLFGKKIKFKKRKIVILGTLFGIL